MTSGQASRMGGWWATLSFFEDLRWGYLLWGGLHASEHRSRHLQVSMPIARFESAWRGVCVRVHLRVRVCEG